MTQLKAQGLVDQINTLTAQKIIKTWEITALEQQLKESDIYKEIEAKKLALKETTQAETELRTQVQETMESQGIKKFEWLWWEVVQLNKKPWKLIIEDDKIPALDDYRKEKTTVSIDKKALKEDIKQGLIIDWVSISEEYTLVIKHK